MNFARLTIRLDEVEERRFYLTRHFALQLSRLHTYFAFVCLKNEGDILAAAASEYILKSSAMVTDVHDKNVCVWDLATLVCF